MTHGPPWGESWYSHPQSFAFALDRRRRWQCTSELICTYARKPFAGSIPQTQLSLDHERDDVRAFYSRFPVPALIAVETSGYSLWFHCIIEALDHQLPVGD